MSLYPFFRFSTIDKNQCLSQDLENGCLKLAVVKYLRGITINMYKFIKIRHDIIKQCHGNHKEMKKIEL